MTRKATFGRLFTWDRAWASPGTASWRPRKGLAPPDPPWKPCAQLPNGARQNYMDVNKARERFNWAPVITLEHGMKLYAASLRSAA